MVLFVVCVVEWAASNPGMDGERRDSKGRYAGKERRL
jgi:hypothetical protein